MGRRGEEEEEKEEKEKGGESHARLYVCLFGPSQEEERRGEGALRVRLLLLTTSGPGSPAHSHEDIVRKLLPPATHLEKVRVTCSLNSCSVHQIKFKTYSV